MSIVHAHIVDGQVVNLIICDSDWEEPNGYIVPSEDNVSIGWLHDGKTFSPPAASPLSKADLVNQIETEKANRIAEAKDTISIWQTKLLLGRKLLKSETERLGLWIDYIDAVSAIKFDAKKEISWPDKP